MTELLRDKFDAKSRIYGTEEALARIFLELLDPSEENIKTVTDVTPQEIFAIPILSAYGKIFESELMKVWINDFLKLRVSRLRIGRKELILLGGGIREYLEGKQKGKVKFGDMFSGL